MKKKFVYIAFIVLLFFIFGTEVAQAQCSICTKTASQLGEKPAKGLNAGILYLAATPLTIVGIIAFTIWRRNKKGDQ